MKRNVDGKFLRKATAILSKAFEHDYIAVATIVCAEADKDYDFIIKEVTTLNNQIGELIENLKKERDLQ